MLRLPRPLQHELAIKEGFTLPVSQALPMSTLAPRSRTRSIVSVAGVGGVLLVGTIGYQAVLRYGRVLVRLRALEEQLDRLVGRTGNTLGLPVGRVVIEDFELAELRGGRMSFSQWRGCTLLLIFFDPTSGPCQQLVPSLAALTGQIANSQPLPVIVSTGDVETNLRVLHSQGVTCPILLQEDWEVGTLFDVRITPMAYLVDQEGRIAAPAAVGAAAILSLGSGDATTAPVRASTASPLATYAPRQVHPAQEGLAVGTRAPAVRVPRLEGGELSLAAYRGRRVLLVFWDPRHGPCLPLASRLEAIHRSSSALAIIVISRGSEQLNRDTAADLGLTFPIGLQRHWDVSREYAMFATPVAYLIDETGTITHDVTIGADAILALATARVTDR